MQRLIIILVAGLFWMILLVFLIGIAALPVQVDHQIAIFDRRSVGLKKLEY